MKNYLTTIKENLSHEVQKYNEQLVEVTTLGRISNNLDNVIDTAINKTVQNANLKQEIKDSTEIVRSFISSKFFPHLILNVAVNDVSFVTKKLVNKEKEEVENILRIETTHTLTNIDTNQKHSYVETHDNLEQDIVLNRSKLPFIKNVATRKKVKEELVNYFKNDIEYANESAILVASTHYCSREEFQDSMLEYDKKHNSYYNTFIQHQIYIPKKYFIKESSNTDEMTLYNISTKILKQVQNCLEEKFTLNLPIELSVNGVIVSEGYGVQLVVNVTPTDNQESCTTHIINTNENLDFVFDKHNDITLTNWVNNYDVKEKFIVENWFGNLLKKVSPTSLILKWSTDLKEVTDVTLKFELLTQKENKISSTIEFSLATENVIKDDNRKYRDCKEIRITTLNNKTATIPTLSMLYLPYCDFDLLLKDGREVLQHKLETIEPILVNELKNLVNE